MKKQAKIAAMTPSQQTTPAPVKRKATHTLYVVTGEGDNSYWTRIGAAVPHKDGKGLQLLCNAFPLTGRIQLREVTEQQDAADAGEQ